MKILGLNSFDIKIWQLIAQILYSINYSIVRMEKSCLAASMYSSQKKRFTKASEKLLLNWCCSSSNSSVVSWSMSSFVSISKWPSSTVTRISVCSTTIRELAWGSCSINKKIETHNENISWQKCLWNSLTGGKILAWQILQLRQQTK